jgi:hypothetical protein
MKNKNITLIAIFLSFVLVSCSEEQTKQTVEGSAVGGVYAEYLFCDFGPDMSDESFAGLLTDWNKILDDLGPNSVPRSAGLVPRVETDLFDGLWVLVWPSKEASLIGWQEWVDGPAADWTEKTSSIISCGASSNGVAQNYGFDVSFLRAPNVVDEIPGGVVGFNFCSYTKDFQEEQLVASSQEYNQWLDAGSETVGRDSYWYSIQVPDFDTPIPGSTAGAYDYAFHHVWDSEESREAGVALFASTAPAVEGPQPDCNPEMALYDSMMFRATDM